MPAKNSLLNRKQRAVGHADKKKFRKYRNKLKKERKRGTRNEKKKT
jgi:hypothetical protein